MSDTKRRDYYIDRFGEPCFGPEWKATSDKKKWYKPRKKSKTRGYVHKLRNDRREKHKEAMRHPDEDGQVILPNTKHSDVWYHN